MLRIFQNAKRLISVCLATLLIVISTITIFPSTASAAVIEINVVKCESGSNCSNIASFAAGATTGIVAGSAVTLAATGNTATIVAVGAAMGQAAITSLAPLVADAGTISASPVLVPVGIAAAGGYAAYQLWHNFSDNQSQNAN